MIEINDMPADTLITREAVVGDVINFQPVNAFATPVFDVAVKPSASSAEFDGSMLTFDAPGAYTITVAVGSMSRTIEVVAFPAAVLTVGPLAHTAERRGAEQARRVLRGVCREVCGSVANDCENNAHPNAIFNGVDLPAFGALRSGEW